MVLAEVLGAFGLGGAVANFVELAVTVLAVAKAYELISGYYENKK